MLFCVDRGLYAKACSNGSKGIDTQVVEGFGIEGWLFRVRSRVCYKRPYACHRACRLLVGTWAQVFLGLRGFWERIRAALHGLAPSFMRVHMVAAAQRPTLEILPRGH